MRQRALYGIPFDGMTFEVRRRMDGPARRVTFQSRGTVRQAFGALRRYGVFAARLVRAEDDPYETHWEVLCPERVGPAERARLPRRAASLYGAWRQTCGSCGAQALFREYRYLADVCCALGMGRTLRGMLLGVDPEQPFRSLSAAREALRRFEETKKKNGEHVPGRPADAEAERSGRGERREQNR